MNRHDPSSPPTTARPKVFRRRYLIDPKRQLRTTLMTTSLVVVLVILVNLGFGFLRSNQASFLSAAAPQLSPVIEEQETVYSLAMVVFSVMLVAAVSIKTIVETHRTAGAVFAVRQRMERVTAGDYDISLRLRENDNLEDLVRPFNAMVASLRDNASRDASRFERLTARAEDLGPAGEDLAAELRGLARDRSRSAS